MADMDRRDFIWAGALGATGLSPRANSDHTGTAVPPSPPEMEEYLARVDAGMERIAQWSPSGQFPGYGGDAAAVDSLLRKSLRTVYITGMFGDLPVEAQVHPGAQERIWAAMPEMDEATQEMEAFLRAQTPEDLARVQEALQTQPELKRSIAEVLDREAETCGVSEWRRRQVQLILQEEGWRLAHQPPVPLVDGYLTKIEKVTATDVDSAARQQWLAAKLSERVFWEDVAGGGGGPLPQVRSKRDQRIWRGARLMGIAILIAGAGGLAVAIGADATIAVGAVLLTVGSVVFIVGIMILLVGLATSADARPSEESEIPPE